MGEMHRAMYGEKSAELLCPLWVYRCPNTSTCSTSQELSKTHPFGFYGDFIA